MHQAGTPNLKIICLRYVYFLMHYIKRKKIMYDIRILIAEDESALRDMIVRYVKREGYTPIEAKDGRQALELVESEEFDLAILDVMMPYANGFEVCKAIRELEKTIPIIMLTARSSTEDKIEGFNSGADQYMPKPFNMKELMVRIKSALKRQNVNCDNITDYGLLHIDKNARLIQVEGEIIDLTPREYDLLLYLSDNKTHALSRIMILERVWGYDFICDERTVDTIVQRVRRKLKSAGKYINTVRSMGYRFEVK